MSNVNLPSKPAQAKDPENPYKNVFFMTEQKKLTIQNQFLPQDKPQLSSQDQILTECKPQRLFDVVKVDSSTRLNDLTMAK